ncbi:hypothetical protein DC20_17850 [Rufibacter tibetensis]|uniref:Acyltransferase 3 domain-containing protein n=2 Tax=Rufibacter tibetensis TaxID=512763 RepID=A0A0P0D0D3_9BACT|nr:hypothetical protein DC20_17850 [Rufibacter tibetensis]
MVGLHLLRIFGAFSVVVIHSSVPITFGFGKVSDHFWFMSNALESFFRSGVGIFLLLSGVLLIPKITNRGEFLKKRLMRVVPPFLFWSFAYCYQARAHFPLTPIEIFQKIVHGASTHLWFVQTIILLYIGCTFFGPLISKLEKRHLLFLLIISEMLLLASLYYEEYPWLNEVRTLWAGFVFMLMGFYFSKLKIGLRKRRIYGLMMFFGGTISTFVGTYLYSKIEGSFQDYFYSILSPIILFKTSGTYLFFTSISLKEGLLLNFIRGIAKTTFGVYLIHPLILDAVLFKLGISYQLVNPLVGVTVTSMLCFAISSLFFYFLSKFRYSNYLM